MEEPLVEIRRERGDAGDVLDSRGELSLGKEFDDLETFAVVSAEVLPEAAVPSTGLVADVPSDPLDSVRRKTAVGEFGVSEGPIVGECGRAAGLGDVRGAASTRQGARVLVVRIGSALVSESGGQRGGDGRAGV